MTAEERLLLKRSREIFETKAHDDIPSIKSVDWKKTMREVEFNVTANMKKNSQSENNKLLASTDFLVAEMLGVKTGQKVRRVEKNRIGKDG